MINNIDRLSEAYFYRKGYETAQKVGDKWPELCQLEVENTELICREEIARQKALYQKHRFEANEITSFFNAGTGERPQQVVEFNYRIGLILSISVALMIATESALCTWGFDPFRHVGPRKYLFALGITSVGFIIFKLILNYLQRSLNPNRYLTLLLYLGTGAAVATVVALLDLAIIRGFLLEALINSDAASEFYSRSGPLMILMFSAMAVAIFLGGGLAMKEAADRLLSSKPVLNMYKRREKSHRSMAETPAVMERLEALPKICDVNFSRGAIEALEQMRRRQERREEGKEGRFLLKLLAFVMVLLLTLFFVSRAFARELTVLGIDLSLSQKAGDFRGETEFDKNLRAIKEQVIANMKPDSTLYVLGITSRSFEKPYWILRAKTGPDPGYFGENLKEEIQAISADWENVSQSLKLTERHTDIFGFLNLAEMVFKSIPADRRVLVLFSDMRHSTSAINLEKPGRIDPAIIEKLKEMIHVPDFSGVDVFCLGMHSYGKSDLYYHSLRRFWLDSFFPLTKGTVRACTNIREVNIHGKRR